MFYFPSMDLGNDVKYTMSTCKPELEALVTKRIPTFLLPALLCSGLSLFAENVITYSGNYVTVSTTLNGGLLPGNTGSADLDGIGNNDSISVIAFGTEYTSGLTEYLGTGNGTVAGPRAFGGQQAIRYDANTLNTGFSPVSQIQNSDQFRVNYVLNSSNGDYQYANATYFIQDDWSNLSSEQAGFGTTEVAFSLDTAGFATQTAGSIRWLIRDGSTFYVSEDSFTPATNTLFESTGTQASADSWAVYAPTAADMRIPDSGYSTLGSTFQNITAVGWVLDVPRFSNGGTSTSVGITVDSFSSDLVAIPEPSSLALIAIALGAVAVFRRRK